MGFALNSRVSSSPLGLAIGQWVQQRRHSEHLSKYDI